MMSRLRVKNLALVRQVTLEFEPGLNVITGETGAGKSILMGALALALGERADRSVIRSGESACGVEAVFELGDTTEIDACLVRAGLDPCEDNQLVLRRIIRASGSGQILVNDQAITLTVLRELGDLLVDMHGPHEHQSLLGTAVQLAILDSFAHAQEERDTYAELWRRYNELLKRRNELKAGEAYAGQQIESLEYRVREIDEAGLSVEEEEEIQREHAISGNAQRILELAGGVTQVLTESDVNVFEQLVSLNAALEELGRLMPEVSVWREEIAAMTSQIQELSATISASASDLEVNPARIEWLEQRMGIYQRLKRRHGLEVSELLDELEASRKRLEDLRSIDEQISLIEGEIAVVHQQLLRTGEALSTKRHNASSQLSASITDELRALGFMHGLFDVHLHTVDPRAEGLDAVEFGFAPNVGERMQPLRHIASSGEISRVMLAVKAVLARHDRIPVLVFDEIDANLGGEMGHAVGEKLGAVADAHQVICITHLPQVAVHGRHHLHVYKQVHEGRTHSDVRILDQESRVEEIARMLGGRGQSSVTLQHAREMLTANSGAVTKKE